MRVDSRKARAQAMVLLSTFFWGSSFVAMKAGLEEIDPFWFASLRLWLAGAGAVAIAYAYNHRLSFAYLRDRDVWVLGILNGVAFIFQFAGLEQTTASKTSLLININVVFVALLSVRLLKERMDGILVVALVAAVAGALLVATEGDLANLSGGRLYGDLLVFACGVVWAFYIVLQKRMVVERGELNLLELTACIMLITGLVTFMPVAASPSLPTISTNGWLFILYLAFFSTLGAYMLWMEGLKELPATVTSLLVLLEVLWAIVLAWLLLGERLGLIGGIGGALIIIAALIASRASA